MLLYKHFRALRKVYWLTYWNSYFASVQPAFRCICIMDTGKSTSASLMVSSSTGWTLQIVKFSTKATTYRVYTVDVKILSSFCSSTAPFRILAHFMVSFKSLSQKEVTIDWSQHHQQCYDSNVNLEFLRVQIKMVRWWSVLTLVQMHFLHALSDVVTKHLHPGLKRQGRHNQSSEHESRLNLLSFTGTLVVHTWHRVSQS